MREVFRDNPQQLRQRRRRADRLATDGGVMPRPPVSVPYDCEAMLQSLEAKAIAGVESVGEGCVPAKRPRWRASPKAV
ncbi:hypothetical protein [Allorhizocola rhizosphaerae]|uniref:hypothetical protein n=1 Tax=Allorhizocola rhizosphaerae TaxID=1872709 RepID=UPI0013C35519|nr:hypothetical protein [Allorhizocola rhizosphaerae]